MEQYQDNAIQPASKWTKAQTFFGILLVASALSWLFKWPHIYLKNPSKKKK